MERPSVRQLECVVAVAEHLSFRKAAEACGISQPALSLQIQQLERMLGNKLFERDRRRVLLAPAGEALLPHARDSLLALDGLLDAARTLQDPMAGTLRLGVIPTVAPYVLPTLVARLRKLFPGLRLLLREDRTANLVERVQDGRLDVALLALEADLGSLETRSLYADPFVLAVPSGHPLAALKTAREQDLAEEEVLLLDEGHCLREQALALCHSAGARELGDFRATSLNTLVRMVAGGAGVTLLPTLALAGEVHSRDRIVTIPMQRRVVRTIGLAWRPTSARRAALERLAETITELAPKGTVPLARARG